MASNDDVLKAITDLKVTTERAATSANGAKDAAEKAHAQAKEAADTANGNSVEIAKIQAELPSLRRDVDRHEGKLETLAGKINGSKRAAQVSGGTTGAVVALILGLAEGLLLWINLRTGGQ